MNDEPIDLVASAGELDPVIETLRVFLHDSGALRTVAVVDGAEPAVVDVARLAPTEVTVGPRLFHLPHAIELDAVPLGRPEIRQLPPFDVDTGDGTVIGTMGGLDMVADALRELVRLLGGRSVALAFWPTTDPDVPLGVGARSGEEPILTLGEDQFTLP